MAHRRLQELREFNRGPTPPPKREALDRALAYSQRRLHKARQIRERPQVHHVGPYDQPNLTEEPQFVPEQGSGNDRSADLDMYFTYPFSLLQLLASALS